MERIRKMSPYEPTYRDGSAKNECWRDDDG